MINIRHSVFETNSSSTHSLVISKKDRGYNYDLPVDENGILTVPFGEFGWGPDILKTPLEKLSYKVTAIMSRQSTYNKSKKALYKLISEDKEIQKVINLVKHHCPQVKDINFELISGSCYPCGYIDHESTGTDNGMETKKLIFDNSVIILIDNDNDSHFYDYDSTYHKPTRNPEDLFDKDLNQLHLYL